MGINLQNNNSGTAREQDLPTQTSGSWRPHESLQSFSLLGKQEQKSETGRQVFCEKPSILKKITTFALFLLELKTGGMRKHQRNPN